MKENNISLKDICAYTIYGLVNALFVYKYMHRLTPQSWVVSLLYLVLVSLFVLLLTRKAELRISMKMQNMIYFSLIFVLAILLTLLMMHFDPQKIRVGRYPALYDWISRFLHSEFPYNTETKPSGFPFLFVLAMPFYWLGDLGFLQIFGFLLFAFLIYLKYRQDSFNRYRLVFLLITAPIFLYEIVVRSDLISNMAIVILYLAIFELIGRKANRLTLCLLGFAGGLLLSTRGIVLLIYIPFFGYFVLKQLEKLSIFFLFMFIGFSLSLLPFMIWDWRSFFDFGPFSRQLTQIPVPWVIVAITCSLYCALKVRTLTEIYSAVSFILFGVVSIAFILSVLKLGWSQAVLKDGFDISYFSFTLPFLLISLDLQKQKIKESNNGVFVLR